MPEKRLPTVPEFLRFKRLLGKLGFRMIQRVEFRKTFERLGLVAPRPKPGREVGFIFYANELVICVWTTWLLSEMRAREEDAGWVVIVQKNHAVYFGGPIHRVGDFFGRLYVEAELASVRAICRPLCLEHHCFMDVIYGQGLGARYWTCPHEDAHAYGDFRTADWDYGLTKAQKVFVKERRRRRALSRKYRRTLGQEVDVARLIRKQWVVGRPQAARVR